MNFAADIDRQRAALLSLVAMLIAGAQFELGKPAVLQRILRATVLYSLRPVESATRRLIFVRAYLLKKAGYGVALDRVRSKPGSRGKGSGVPPFSLFDARRRFASNGKPRYAKHGPRITVFGYDDDFGERPTPKPKRAAPKYDDLLDATTVFHRLLAVTAALEDVPKQAKRMLRMQALREGAGKGRAEPLRRGTPPGHRARGKWQADEALRDCHQMALAAMAAPDSS